MEIREGNVYVNKETREFMHIKEVTFFTDDERIAQIVCSRDCTFLEDSKTTVMRQVFTYQEFIYRYEDHKKTLSDKRNTLNPCKDITYPFYEESDVKEFIKDLKKELSINDEGYKVIDELAGDKLI